MTSMICINDMGTLQYLMEARHEPVLIQILSMLSGRGGFTILQGYHPVKNPKLPVKEIILDPDHYQGSQLFRLVTQINSNWKYNQRDIKRVAEVVQNPKEVDSFLLNIKTCDETRRR